MNFSTTTDWKWKQIEKLKNELETDVEAMISYKIVNFSSFRDKHEHPHPLIMRNTKNFSLI